MYLVGVKPSSDLSKPIVVIPEVAGLSSAGLTALKNNEEVVSYSDLRIGLRGVVAGVTDNTLILRNGDSFLTIELTDSTSVFEPPKESGGEAVDLRISDLQQNDAVTVSAQLQGDRIVANSIIRDIPPSVSQ